MKGRKRGSGADRRPLPAGSGPVRTCVACGHRDRQNRLIRIRSEASGTLAIEKAGRGGRGAYLHTSGDCVGTLRSEKLLRRSLRVDIGTEARAEIVAKIANERPRDSCATQGAID